MASRKNSVEIGMRLLGSMDNFGAGVSVEDLFPEFIEEELLIGVNEIDFYFEDARPRQMDFKTITEAIPLEDLTDADLPGAEDDEEYYARLFGDDLKDPVRPEFSELQCAILVNEMLRSKRPYILSKKEMEFLAEVEKVLLLKMAFLFGTPYYESRDSRYISRRRHSNGISHQMISVPAVVHFQTQNVVTRSNGTAVYIVEMPC